MKNQKIIKRETTFPYAGYPEIVIDEKPVRSICQFNPFYGHNGPEKTTFEERQYYAKLFAVAPKLLKSLSEIVKYQTDDEYAAYVDSNFHDATQSNLEPMEWYLMEAEELIKQATE